MSTLTLSPQRLAELEQFAREHGQTAEDVLDEAVSGYLDWQTSAFETDEAQYAADLDEAFEEHTALGSFNPLNATRTVCWSG